MAYLLATIIFDQWALFQDIGFLFEESFRTMSEMSFKTSMAELDGLLISHK